MAHASRLGQKRKKREREKERAKVGDNNGQATHGARRHVWRTQAAWANYLYPEHEQLGDYHWSKDKVKGESPYQTWFVNKRFTLNEELAVHLLRWQQVCIIIRFMSRISWVVIGAYRQSLYITVQICTTET